MILAILRKGRGTRLPHTRILPRDGKGARNMKTNYLALSLLAIAVLAGCAQQHQPQSPDSQHAMTIAMPDLAKEEAAIRATDAQWLAAVKSRDAEKAAAFWSDDAT